MTCQDARELFPALADGHIGLTERLPLEAHLSECGDCKNLLEVLRPRERPRTIAWRPRLEFGLVHRAYEAPRTLAMISLVASAFGNLRPAAIAGRVRRPHARVRRINWRPRLRLDRIRALLEAVVQRLDIRPRLRRASITIRHQVPRPRFDFAVIRNALDAIRRSRSWHRSRRPISLHARPTTRRGLGLDAIRKALPSLRSSHVLARMRAWVWPPSRFVRPVRAGLKHLRLPVTLAAATIGAMGVFSYRAELDGAFRRWVPTAPSVAEAPPPTQPPVIASTERTPRPELPSVSPSRAATSVPASSPPAPAIERPKRSAPHQEPVTARSGAGAAAPMTAPTPGTTRDSLDVIGKLVVKSRGGAERDLTALVARAGGTTVSRQRGPHVTVIEAVVPNPNYGRFAAGLNRIGSWQIEAGRTSLPDPVRVAVRLAE